MSCGTYSSREEAEMAYMRKCVADRAYAPDAFLETLAPRV